MQRHAEAWGNMCENSVRRLCLAREHEQDTSLLALTSKELKDIHLQASALATVPATTKMRHAGIGEDLLPMPSEAERTQLASGAQTCPCRMTQMNCDMHSSLLRTPGRLMSLVDTGSAA